MDQKAKTDSGSREKKRKSKMTLSLSYEREASEENLLTNEQSRFFSVKEFSTSRETLRSVWEAGVTKESLSRWSRRFVNAGDNANLTRRTKSTVALSFATEGLAGGLAQEMDESFDFGWEEDRITCYLVFCCMSFAIGSCFIFGYNLCDLSTPALMINDTFLSKIYVDREDKNSVDTSVAKQTVFLWQLTIASFFAGCLFGCVGSAFLSDRLGRRKANILNQFPTILSGILSLTSFYIESPELLIVSRFLVGITGGAGFNYVPLYLIEIAPTKYRGGISAVAAMTVCFGILVAQILSMPQVLGSEELWPYLTGFNVIPASISLLLLPFCVESPRYLYIIKNDKKGAESAWRRLLGREDVSNRIKEMEIEKKMHELMKYRIVDLFSDKNTRWPLFMACILRLLLHCSGVDAIQTYSGIIFSDMGVKKSIIPTVIVALGLINLIAVWTSLFYIDKLERRKFLIIICCVTIINFIVLTISLVYEQRLPHESNRKSSDYSNNAGHKKLFLMITIIGCIVIYQICTAICLTSIPACISCEIFQQGTRSAAISFSQAAAFLFRLILSATFLWIKNALGPFTFIPFIVLIAVIALFIFIYVPETKDKSFNTISSQIQHGRPVVQCCTGESKPGDA